MEQERMTERTRNRTVEYLLAGTALLLTASALLQATPARWLLYALPALLALYVLMYGVERSLRNTAAWCMSWAEGIAHRKKVGGKWEARMAGRTVKAAGAAGVYAGEGNVTEVEIAEAV